MMDVLLTPPRGLEEIIRVFGDPRPLIGRDGFAAPSWELQHITRVKLPRPLRFAHSEIVRVACHSLIGRHVRELFEDIDDLGMWDEISEFGSSYVIKGTIGGALSTHAWGIAFDLVPKALIPSREIIGRFAHYGFSWGGPRRPYHFQFATDYGLPADGWPVREVQWRPEDSILTPSQV